MYTLIDQLDKKLLDESKNNDRYIKLVSTSYGENIYNKILSAVLMPRDGILRLKFIQFYNLLWHTNKFSHSSTSYFQLKNKFPDIESYGMNIQYMIDRGVNSTLIDYSDIKQPYHNLIVPRNHFDFVKKIEIEKEKPIQIKNGNNFVIKFNKEISDSGFFKLSGIKPIFEEHRLDISIVGSLASFSKSLKMNEPQTTFSLRQEGIDNNIIKEVSFEPIDTDLDFLLSIEEFVVEK